MPLPDISLIHDRYLTLSRRSHERFGGIPGGKLLLRARFDAEGIAVAIAASVAGAVTLCVDADAEALRQGLRAGLCDFVVANLDEALRILKNEVRRRLPVSVCLSADPEACTAELAERGVQPDLLSLDAAESMPGAQLMLDRGALLLADAGIAGAGTSLLRWSVAADAARMMPRIATIAAEVLHNENAGTPVRRRWLEVSPRYLGRAFGWQQCLRMKPPEAAAFVERVRAMVPEAKIERDGKPAA
jgi:hypothetical protein